MTYADNVGRVADNLTVAVLAVIDALLSGHVTADEAEDMLTSQLAAATTQARMLAAVAVAAAIEQATGQPTAPVALSSPDMAAVRKAVRTLLAGVRPDMTDDDRTRVRTALERVADNVPHQAGTYGFTDAMQRSPAVEGYTRGVEPNACVQCAVWHWRDGYVWPKNKPFWRHTGCRCHPIPTMKENKR